MRFNMSSLCRLGGALTALTCAQVVVAQPTINWRTFWNDGAGSISHGQHIERLSSGEFVVAGQTTVSGSFDFLVQKYSASGVLVWSTIVDVGSDDRPRAVTVDGVGNVFVAGYYFNGSRGFAGVIIRVNSAGVHDWSYSAGREFIDIAGLGGGGAVACGTINNGTKADDARLVKIDGAGIAWTRDWHSGGSNSDRANGVDVDTAGRVYLAASTQVSGGGQRTQRIVQYSTAGVKLWAKTFASGTGSAYSHSIVAKPNGGCVVLGMRGDTAGNLYSSDMMVSSHDLAGTQMWRSFYNGPINGEDTPTALARNGSGMVAAVGYSKNANDLYESVALLYDLNGTRVYARRSLGPNSYQLEPTGVALLSDGTCYFSAVAYTNTPTYTSNAYVLKYNPTGTRLWHHNYNGPGAARDAAWDVVTDSLGNATLVGSSENASSAIYDVLLYQLR